MRVENGTVKVKYKNGQGVEAMAESPVTYEVFESAQDILALLQTKEGVELVIKDLNNSRNMTARAEVRAKILAEVEGPGKAIAKMIKATIAAVLANTGVTLTEEEATNRLKAAGVI